MGVLENCFLGIFSASIRMSVIIIFLLLAKYFVTTKYTAKCRYYLWLIVIIGLLVPINLSESHSIINLPITQNVIVSENINIDSEQSSLKGAVAIEKLDDKPLQSQTNKEISILGIVAVIWIAGILIYLSINISRHLIFINTVKRWFCDTNEELLTKCLEKTKEELNIKINIKLKRCKIIQTPMLIGIFKSQILIPMNSFSEDEIRFILKHELTHFKRKDLLYKLITFITNAVHWFNPIIYLMNKEISYECESSCDEAIMKSEPINRRKLYGEMILNAMLEDVKKKSVLSTCFYGGKKEMQRRLKNIIDTKIKKNGIVVFLLLVLIIAGSTFILGFSMNNKINNTAKESAEESNLENKIEISQDKITTKEIAEPHYIEKDKNSKDDTIISAETVPNSNKLNEESKVTNSLGNSVESDFIKKIDNSTSDEEFTQKVDKVLDPSFVIPKE